MTLAVMQFESKPNGMDVRIGWTEEPGATAEEKRLAEGMSKVLKDLVERGVIGTREKGGGK